MVHTDIDNTARALQQYGCECTCSLHALKDSIAPNLTQVHNIKHVLALGKGVDVAACTEGL